MDCKINVVTLDHGKGLPLPKYETSDSAGMDLYAALGEGETITLGPLERALIPTGLAMALPHAYEAQVRPRSGLAAKNGVTVANSPGTIDADYRGEVKVILVNLSNDPFTIERGMRVAQMVIAPVTQGTWVEVENLDETERGTGGFGSTGTH
ncbi:dUTP diphosphatase [Kordiimonas sediminis]